MAHSRSCLLPPLSLVVDVVLKYCDVDFFKGGDKTIKKSLKNEKNLFINNATNQPNYIENSAFVTSSKDRSVILRR